MKSGSYWAKFSIFFPMIATDRTTTPTLMEALTTTTVLEVLRILLPTVTRTRLAVAATVGQASKQWSSWLLYLGLAFANGS